MTNWQNLKNSVGFYKKVPIKLFNDDLSGILRSLPLF